MSRAVAGARQPLQNITRANHVLPICYQQPFTKEDGELWVAHPCEFVQGWVLLFSPDFVPSTHGDRQARFM